MKRNRHRAWQNRLLTIPNNEVKKLSNKVKKRKRIIDPLKTEEKQKTVKNVSTVMNKKSAENTQVSE